VGQRGKQLNPDCLLVHLTSVRYRKESDATRIAAKRQDKPIAVFVFAGAPGVLSIDLVALAENWRILARRAAPGRGGQVGDCIVAA